MSRFVHASMAQVRRVAHRPLATRLSAGVALVALALLAGCGEREQALQPGASSGTYQGKPDGKPWDNKATSYGASQWPQGDRGAWERVIKTRNQAQNEYARTQ